jgi:hypothetical protein
MTTRDIQDCGCGWSAQGLHVGSAVLGAIPRHAPGCQIVREFVPTHASRSQQPERPQWPWMGKLVKLRVQVEAALELKVTEQRRALESELSKLGGFSGGRGRAKGFGRGGARGAVAPKYRNLRFGDDTALRLGRVTFNPLKHIDAMGTIVLPALLLFLRCQSHGRSVRISAGVDPHRKLANAADEVGIEPLRGANHLDVETAGEDLFP